MATAGGTVRGMRGWLGFAGGAGIHLRVNVPDTVAALTIQQNMIDILNGVRRQDGH